MNITSVSIGDEIEIDQYVNNILHKPNGCAFNRYLYKFNNESISPHVICS